MMEHDSSQPQHLQTMSKPHRSPMRAVAIGVIVIVVAGLALLVWQKNQEIGTVSQQLSDSENKLAEQIKKSQQSAVGGDLKVETAIGGMALDTVEATMSNAGESRMTYEAKISYMDDNFARVDVDYTVGKAKPSGKGEFFIFKKVNRSSVESWALIGINPLTVEEQTTLKNRYGMPANVLTESNQ
jgi:hypothetical protein